MQKIISNSSPLINLSKIGKLYLIKDLYNQIIIPEGVYNELIVRGESKEKTKDIYELIHKDIISVHQVKNYNLVKSFQKDLDYGESEVIALAIEENADLIIIDEVNARQIAGIYNLRKTGFIGVLLKAKEKGLIDSVMSYIDEAMNKGFWLNSKIYKSLSELTGE